MYASEGRAGAGHLVVADTADRHEVADVNDEAVGRKIRNGPSAERC